MASWTRPPGGIVMKKPEDAAREQIDAALEQAGWVVQDADAANVHAGRGVAIREFPLKQGHGFADYLLYVDGKAAGVIEAKKAGTTLTGVETQAAKYSEGLPGRPAGPSPAPAVPLPDHRRRDPVHQLARPRPAEPPRLPLPPARDPGRVAGRVPDDAPQAAPRHAPDRRAGSSGRRSSRPSRTWRSRSREDRPRALIQMATGSGKTFTAVTAIYRLIKFADAPRVLFLVDRANLGRADAQGVPAVRHARRRPQVHRALQRPAPDQQPHRPGRPRRASRPSSASTRCSGARPTSTRSWRKARSSTPRPASSASRRPSTTTRRSRSRLRRPLHRRVPPLDLRPLAAGPGILRRLPRRPHRHALEADVRLLQPEPRDGVQPRAGRRRRRERRLRRLPHPHPDHRGRLDASRPGTSSTSATARPAPSAGRSSTTT